ncbi:MAG: ZIP family metal transporter [Planctomycetia bacterium]|nr:ZIP family metal transporter [Planctomycetia bacterium]
MCWTESGIALQIEHLHQSLAQAGSHETRDHGGATHEHDHAHGDHAHAVDPVHGTDLHTAQDAAAPRGRPLIWLAAYCVVVVAASLWGGWLPQRFDLSHNRMQVAISLIGGLMLGIGVFHMLPHALVELGADGPDLAAHGMMAGLVVMFLLLRAFHFHHHGTLDSLHNEHDASSDPSLAHGREHDHDQGRACRGPAGPAGARNLSWVGVFLGMAFHSIGDGLALGASVEADVLHGQTMWLGLGTFLAVTLHKPVDSISITTLMAAGGWSSKSRMLVNAGFSLICPAGAVLFVLGVREFSERQALIVGLALAISAGVFICIALGDLLPEMEFHSHNRVRLTVALLAGVALAWGIRFLEPPHAHSHSQGAAHGGDHAHGE